MGLVQGSYVKCKAVQRKGVVAHISADGRSVYVEWLASWDGGNNATSYLEYSNVAEISELLSEHIDRPLITLNRRIMR